MNRSRRIKPQLDDHSDYEDEYSSTSDQDQFASQNDEEMSESDSQGEASRSKAPTGNTISAISQISFGSLAKAQASLKKDQRRASSQTKLAVPTADEPSSKPSDTKKPKETENIGRNSKHAPQELSSKRAVTRKRMVVEPVTRQKARDPRFDAAVNGVFDERHFRNNYAFLDDYRNDEMKMLKEEIKKTKDEKTRERLAQKLKSMESQQQSQRNKDKVQEVLKEHKKKEKEKVKQGKKAFHLKQSDVKKIILEERFSKLSEKQVDRVMARKQKRKTQKERKNMPWARRET